MAKRYQGARLSATPPTTTGGTGGSASGMWSLEEQIQLQNAGLWPSQPIPQYIEDYFNTYLYTGNGSTQTLTTGVNLASNGGMLWIKARSSAISHFLFDTNQGFSKSLNSNAQNASATASIPFASTTTTGFGVDAGWGSATNGNGTLFTGWTFRKQPKFFDVVSWTGDGAARTINHNLGSVPGCIIIKRTDSASNWTVWHRGCTSPNASWWLNYGLLQDTAAFNYWGDNSGLSAQPTSTSFSLGSGLSDINTSGGTYVAYLFAHNASGFGPLGNQNVISCGSFVASGNVDLNLGYEPQFFMLKCASNLGDWSMLDTMRGFPVNGQTRDLSANQVAAENTGNLGTGFIYPTSSGVRINGGVLSNAETYIYLAIRRGPMRTPTNATKVFVPTFTSAAAGTSISVGFAADMTWAKSTGFSDATYVEDKLRGYANAQNSTSTGTGNAQALNTTSTGVESSASYPMVYRTYNTTQLIGSYYGGSAAIYYNFARAPGFFDEVCYSQTPTTTPIAHNLGVVPELVISKSRVTSPGINSWVVWSAYTGTTAFYLNATNSAAAYWSTTPATSTSIYTSSQVVGNGTADTSYTFVSYLFATCTGVSKVGTYTGTGAAQTIDCGFAGGARFVMIKRTDASADWYVWDTARGIISGNDPFYLLNSTAQQNTSTDYLSPQSVGFGLTATAPAALNASGGTYLYLAIA